MHKQLTITRLFVRTLIVSVVFMLILCAFVLIKDRSEIKRELLDVEKTNLTQSTPSYYSELVIMILNNKHDELEKFLNEVKNNEDLSNVEVVTDASIFKQVTRDCSLKNSDYKSIFQLPSCYTTRDGKIEVIQEISSGGAILGYIIKTKSLVISTTAAIKQHLQRGMFMGLYVALFGLFYVWQLRKYLVKPLKYLAKNAETILSKNEQDKYNISELRTLSCALSNAHNSLLEKSNLAAIGASASMIAHDVRRPLTSMRSLLQVLPELRDNPKEIDQLIDAANAKIDETNKMLDEILDFSRDASALNMGQAEPKKLIEAAVNEVLTIKKNTSLQIDLDIESRNHFKVDSIRIKRVLENIIANAVEAMDGKGKIWIVVKDTEVQGFPRMQIAISNDGPEISEDVRQKIFDPFFTRGKKGGTGLGLAITQKIINMHGGNIRIESSADRTEFIFDLPLIFSNALCQELPVLARQDEHKNKVQTNSSGQKNVLVLNDDHDLLTAMDIMLRSPGLKILKASTMTEAIDHLNSHAIDCIFSDIDLRTVNVDGFDFLKHVRANVGNTPFYFISGYKKIDEWPQAEKLGANGYYQLPIDFNILKEVI